MLDEVRKIVTFSETTFIEGGRAGTPVQATAVCAVLRNPWHGNFEANLRPGILRLAKPLGECLVPILVGHFGGPDRIEAYGKAALVGTSGEIEHGSALIHTLRFGNILRDGAGGTQFLPFTNTRGGAGSAISIPMVHKNKLGTRSHFLTVQFSIQDAPGHDEIVIAIAASSGPRVHARIGDRYEDMAEMEKEKIEAI